MDWVRDFYAKQDAWLGVYSGPITDTDYKRVVAVARLSGDGPHRILELGAGGGQTAAALADAGHSVTAIELVPTAAQHARELAVERPANSMTVIEGDLYHVQVEGPFDSILYWDGFGVGYDTDQRRLLARVASWLAPHGCALIDVNTPWYWAQAAGREMRFERVVRRYDFDATECRMLDRWWPSGAEEQAVIQSLRCYSPADLELLLEGTGLALDTVEPGGAVEYEAHRYHERVSLGQAMQYLARLVHAKHAA
jgi:SAM-dependent methyltransferase